MSHRSNIRRIGLCLLAALILLPGCRTVPADDEPEPLAESESAVDTEAAPESESDTTADADAEAAYSARFDNKRKEIEDAMTLAAATTPRVVKYPDMNPETKKYSNIEAITFDGLDRDGMKTKTFAYLSIPQSATPENPIPAVVLVPGGSCQPMDLEWLRVWASRGYASICVCTAGTFPTERNIDLWEGEDEPYEHGPKGIFAEEGYTLTPQASVGPCDGDIEDMWLTYAVSDTILAANVLRADPRIRADAVGITGVSWGSVVASISIAYDDRFAFAIPVYGSAYLEESMAALKGSFQPVGFRELWAAEDRYDRVTMPVLWLCSNNDNCFSINSNSDSFLATMNNNPLTRLSIRDKFGHSHSLAWGAPESYTFAASVVKGTTRISGFLEQPSGRDIHVKIDFSGRAAVTPTLYYLTEPMTYGVTDPSCFLDQEWHTMPLDYDTETNVVSGTVPDEAAGYYIELRESKEVSCSAYVALP